MASACLYFVRRAAARRRRAWVWVWVEFANRRCCSGSRVAGDAMDTKSAPGEDVKDLFPRNLGRKIVPAVLVAIVAYAALFVFADAEATVREMARVPSRAVLAACLLSLLSFFVRALRWHALLRRVRSNVPFFDSVLVNFAGLAMTITPGKAGEVIKSLLLKEAFEVPVAESAPIVMLERLADLVAIVLLGGVALLLVPGAATAGVVTVAGGIALALLVAALPRALEHVPHRLAKVRFIAPRREKLQSSFRALGALVSPGSYLPALGLSLVAWGVQSLTVWLLAATYPEIEISVVDGVVAYCAPLLAGALALVPGGLGATEASMAGVLVVLAGSTSVLSVAAALTVLVRLVTFWLAVAVGLVALATWRLRRTGIPLSQRMIPSYRRMRSLERSESSLAASQDIEE